MVMTVMLMIMVVGDNVYSINYNIYFYLGYILINLNLIGSFCNIERNQMDSEIF